MKQKLAATVEEKKKLQVESQQAFKQSFPTLQSSVQSVTKDVKIGANSVPGPYAMKTGSQSMAGPYGKHRLTDGDFPDMAQFEIKEQKFVS